MTDGQAICLYVFGGWVVLFALAVLVGKFLRAGGPDLSDCWTVGDVAARFEMFEFERDYASKP